MSLPTTHKAVIVPSLRDPLDIKIQELPTPSPTPGSAVLKVLSVYVSSGGEAMFSGKAAIPLQLPFFPGYSAVCRVAAVGPDAVLLRPGQLVFSEINIRARDQPSVNILQGGFFAVTPAQKHLAKEWNKGSYAEYVSSPLENIFPLDEDLLINKMGYSFDDLSYLPLLTVPMGGLVDLNVKPGQSVIVAPATGAFGGATVVAALASGARVVAAGRNEDTLKAMVQVLGPQYGDRLTYVKLTGTVEVDTEALNKASPGGNGFDAYIDFSPPQAAMTTHITSCLGAMKTFGKVCLMGYIHGNIQIPYAIVVLKSLEIRGRYMYDRKAIVQLLDMVEAGVLKLGKAGGIEVVGAYKLDEIEAALRTSTANPGFGKLVVVSPNSA